MLPPQPTIDTLLDVARDLIAQRVFDRDVALEVLATLPTQGLDHQTVGAIVHARLVVLTGPKFTGEAATAQSALARVVELVERRNRSSEVEATSSQAKFHRN